MRVMFRFEKKGPVRYISHLDLLRAMQRALLRSGLPLIWSQGFHPHPQFTFAMALPVGAESAGEYMEVALADGKAEEAALRMNGALGPGLRILQTGVLPDSAPSLMAAVAASDWIMEAPGSLDRAGVDSLLARNEILVEKTGKRGTRMVDIRPGILSLELVDTPAGRFLQGKLAAGSQNNVAPGLLLKALMPGEDTLTLGICRRELYYNRDRQLRPLIEMVCGD